MMISGHKNAQRFRPA